MPDNIAPSTPSSSTRRHCVGAAFGCVVLTCVGLSMMGLVRGAVYPPGSVIAKTAQGTPEDLQEALDAGGDPHVASRTGCSALHVAAERDDPRFTEILLEHVPPVNAIDSHGQTPLHLAATWGGAETCELLLCAGADVTLKDSYGDTPLDRAAQRGDPRIVAAFARLSEGTRDQAP